MYYKSLQGGEYDYLQIATLYECSVIDCILYKERADIGNFLWGYTMAKIGIPKILVKLGSEFNAFFNGKKQNQSLYGQVHWYNRLTLSGDSKADQQAIKHGYEYFNKN